MSNFVAGRFSNCVIKVAKKMTWQKECQTPSIFVTNSGAFAIPGKRWKYPVPCRIKNYCQTFPFKSQSEFRLDGIGAINHIFPNEKRRHYRVPILVTIIIPKEFIVFCSHTCQSVCAFFGINLIGFPHRKPVINRKLSGLTSFPPPYRTQES